MDPREDWERKAKLLRAAVEAADIREDPRHKSGAIKRVSESRGVSFDALRRAVHIQERYREEAVKSERNRRRVVARWTRIPLDIRARATNRVLELRAQPKTRDDAVILVGQEFGINEETVAQWLTWAEADELRHHQARRGPALPSKPIRERSFEDLRDALTAFMKDDRKGFHVELRSSMETLAGPRCWVVATFAWKWDRETRV